MKIIGCIANGVHVACKKCRYTDDTWECAKFHNDENNVEDIEE